MKKIFTMFLLCAGTIYHTSAFACDYHGLVDMSETEWTWNYILENLKEEKKSVDGDTYVASLKGNGTDDRLHKNNYRETIVFIPKTTKASKPVDIIFYFHGLGGFKERDFKKRTLKHTTSVPSDKNYILVIPEMPWSRNTSTPRGRQGLVFTKKGEFAAFFRGVDEVVKEHYKKRVQWKKAILLGHSAGGSALMSISKSGGLDWLYRQNIIKSMKIIFSDASYGYWLDIAWKYHNTQTQNTKFIVLTRKGDRPYKHAKRFLKRFNKQPNNIQHVIFSRRIKHSEIGDGSFKWVYCPENSSGCGKGKIK